MTEDSVNELREKLNFKLFHLRGLRVFLKLWALLFPSKLIFYLIATWSKVTAILELKFFHQLFPFFIFCIVQWLQQFSGHSCIFWMLHCTAPEALFLPQWIVLLVQLCLKAIVWSSFYPSDSLS